MRGKALLIAAAIAAGPLAGAAAANPPRTSTVHGTDTYIQSGAFCNNEQADATWELRYIEHITDHDDGRLHISASARGTVSWIQDEVAYVARFTTSFNLNMTGAAETVTITLHGNGHGADGSRVRLAETGHATVTPDGRVVVEFLNDTVTCTATSAGGPR